MTMDIDRIKLELLIACERDATVDIATWTERFPEHREELLDFWLWARPRSGQDEGPYPTSAGLTDISREALHRACLAASLGSEWLRPLVLEVEVDQIARQIRLLRKQSPPSTPAGRRAFRRAVVYAWIIEQLGTVRTSVSRFATQKTAYLLESFLLLELFDTHQKKPLGPYDHIARYKDAEPIAIRKGWIRAAGTTLEAGERTAEVQRYAQRYLRSMKLALSLTLWLGRLTDDQLETLATVHWVASKLGVLAPGLTPSIVREELEKDAQWRSKLQRLNFSHEQVGAALGALICLGLFETP